MLQLAATLKAKAALLEKEAWGHLAGSLVGSKTSGLWDLLEDLFGKMSEAEEEKSPLSERSQSEDKSSTSGSGSICTYVFFQHPTTCFYQNYCDFSNEWKFIAWFQALNLNICLCVKNYPMTKLYISVRFHCGYHAQSRTTMYVPIFTKSIYMLCWGVLHYEHHVWSTDAWAIQTCTQHLGFPMFVEVKLGCVMTKESEEILVVLTASQISSGVPSTST